MALPTIIIDTATGSNTQASGAGPATAVFGSGATTVNGSPNVAIASAVDLSGVAVDGSAVLYVGLSSGRRFSKITAISGSAGAWTVTVEDTVWTAGSGLTWAIGGRRKDWETSNQNTKIILFSDAKPGWTIDQREGTYSITSTITVGVKGDAVNGKILWTSTSTNRPVNTTATNGVPIITFNDADIVEVRHLHLTNTAATRSFGCRFVTGASGPAWIRDCIIDGMSNGVEIGVAACTIILEGTEIKNCTTNGINASQASTVLQVTACDIHDNAGPGIAMANVSGQLASLQYTIFDTNTYGVRCVATSNSPNLGAYHCTFVDNTNDGIELSALGGASQYTLSMINNVFYGNGGYGVDSAEPSVEIAWGWHFANAYGGNGTADRNGIVAGLHDLTLSADPFTDRTGRDFSPNETAGGGAILRGASLGGFDIGAVQHEDTGGGAATLAVSKGRLIGGA